MYDYRYLEKISETDDLLLFQVKYPENLPLYDNKQLMSPILIGDTLYKYGKLDSARQQYEKAYGLGFPEAKNKLEQINLMNHIDKGNYYLSKANEFRRDIYLKAALDEYQLAVEKDQDIFQKKMIAEKVDAVYSTAMSISPHIWGRLSRIKVE
jgi:tetratricopeptide (TPR) repeat protein